MPGLERSAPVKCSLTSKLVSIYLHQRFASDKAPLASGGKTTPGADWKADTHIHARADDELLHHFDMAMSAG